MDLYAEDLSFDIFDLATDNINNDRTPFQCNKQNTFCNEYLNSDLMPHEDLDPSFFIKTDFNSNDETSLYE